MPRGPSTSDSRYLPDPPHRREFIKRVASATLASPFVAPIVHASDKAGKKRAIVGTEQYRYECIHDWAMQSLPRGAHYGNASHGVTIDSAGLIYITHYGDPGSIFVFDPEGKYVNDLMLVPDLHCRITLLDGENRVVTQLGDDPKWRAKALDGFKMRGQRGQWQPGKFIHPHDACFDAEGNIYVTEWVPTGRVTKLQRVGG